jgi:hypothetical protein
MVGNTKRGPDLDDLDLRLAHGRSTQIQVRAPESLDGPTLYGVERLYELRKGSQGRRSGHQLVRQWRWSGLCAQRRRRRLWRDLLHVQTCQIARQNVQINPSGFGCPLYEDLAKSVEKRFEGVISLRQDGCSKHYAQTIASPNEHDLLYLRGCGRTRVRTVSISRCHTSQLLIRSVSILWFTGLFAVTFKRL